MARLAGLVIGEEVAPFYGCVEERSAAGKDAFTHFYLSPIRELFALLYSIPLITRQIIKLLFVKFNLYFNKKIEKFCYLLLQQAEEGFSKHHVSLAVAKNSRVIPLYIYAREAHPGALWPQQQEHRDKKKRQRCPRRAANATTYARRSPRGAPPIDRRCTYMHSRKLRARALGNHFVFSLHSA